MTMIYELNEGTLLAPDDVDGTAEFIDPDNDVGPTWDPEVDDFPDYLGDLSAPS